MTITTKEITIKELNDHAHILQFNVGEETASIVFSNPDSLHRFIGKLLTSQYTERDSKGW